MSYLPIDKICGYCGKIFHSPIPGTVCLDCLIRPKKKDKISEPIIEKKGAPMAQDCKEKTCVDCLHPFKPTSNVQKRCPACMKKHAKEYQKNKKKYPCPAIKKNIKPEAPEDSFVLQMLIAAGLVSEEKILKAREIFRTLKK